MNSSGATVSASTRWELYRLLGEPARLRLLALAGEDELAVSELAELLQESQPNVSRHAAPLRQSGLLSVRKQGTWTLMRLAEGAQQDPVVADALRTGRSLCEQDGTLRRVAEVVHAREHSTREFFARARNGAGNPHGAPSELAAYLRALSVLLPRRGLAVDAGTGDGRSLELLCPLFEQVLAVDRAEAQLSECRARIQTRGFDNVTVLQSEFDGPELRAAVRAAHGAELILAARVLHHAPRPSETIRQLATLLRPGGTLLLLDYEHHEDEALREQQADLWLGFDGNELRHHLQRAGLVACTVLRIPLAFNGSGPDRHLQWQLVAGRMPDGTNHPATSDRALVEQSTKTPKPRRKSHS